MILLMYAVGATWFLEQPHSSLMPRHIRFQWLIRVLEDLGLKAGGSQTKHVFQSFQSLSRLIWLRQLFVLNSYPCYNLSCISTRVRSTTNRFG